jgi:hypothetical protein
VFLVLVEIAPSASGMLIVAGGRPAVVTSTGPPPVGVIRKVVRRP